VTSVNAEVRRIATHDGVDLSEISVSGVFHFAIRMDIGIRGHDGIDSFDLWICSTSWLELQSFPFSGQYLVIVDKFDARRIESFLRGEVIGISGRTSSEVLSKLSRFAYWEYSDMTSLPSRMDDNQQ
jgi:Immunity protein 8